MAFKSCGSDNQQKLGTEINIHFPRRDAFVPFVHHFHDRSVMFTEILRMAIPQRCRQAVS